MHPPLKHTLMILTLNYRKNGDIKFKFDIYHNFPAFFTFAVMSMGVALCLLIHTQIIFAISFY